MPINQVSLNLHPYFHAILGPYLQGDHVRFVIDAAICNDFAVDKIVFLNFTSISFNW